MPHPNPFTSANKRGRAGQIAAGGLFALVFLVAGVKSNSDGWAILFTYSGLIAGGCIAGWKAAKPKSNAALVGAIVQLVYLGTMVYGALTGRSEPPDLPFVPVCTFGFLVLICVVGGVIAQFVSVQSGAFPKYSAPGRCIWCNYGLTGNTSGICPECGKAVSDY